MQRILFIVFAGATLVFSACGGSKKETATTDEKPVTVTTAVPGGNATDGISISGKVEALQTAHLSTRLMGTITRIYVKAGDRVRSGQVLATVNSQDIAAKRAQTNAAILEAEAHLKNAQKDYERFTNLYNKQSASAKELDNVTLQYNAAKARVEAASQMRNEVNAMGAYASITAPFDGVVTQRMADEGNMANPGMPILVVEQSGQLQVSATVSENQIAGLKKGTVANVDIQAIGKTIQCPVTEISPSSQLTGGQYDIKLTIPAKDKQDLYAGMYVNVFIPGVKTAAITTDGNRVLVPTSALVQNDQLTGIYTISSANTAILRWVRTGKVYGDQTEILSGLNATETFIQSAEGKLYNGAPVTVKK